MFTIHEVASGVWAAVSPEVGGPAVSNATIVDLGGATLVVDTFMTMEAAEVLAAESRRLTGRDAHLVVNTHWHVDHVRGNGAFGGAPVVGTQRMRDQIAASSGDFPVVLPDVLMGDRLDLVGERRATILGYGPGHTDGDLFVHLPDDGVVVAGDLVWTGFHPKTDDGYPAAWAAVLDRIAELSPTQVVPGHGEVGALADVVAMAGYLRALDGLVAAVRSGDVDSAYADPPRGSERWDGVERFRRGLAALAARPRPHDPA